MFAVPGWSVSASSLKTQDLSHVSGEANAKSRKRKRKSKPAKVQDEVHGTGANNIKIGEVVSSVDRSDTPERPNKKSKSDKKQQLSGKDETPSKPTTHSEDPTARKTKSAKPEAPKKTNSSAPKAPTIQAPPPSKPLTPLQQKMHQKLISARFRHLNETLYTAPSTTSLSLFTDQPSMFADYHSGFRQQVSVWPSNPVEAFIASLAERAAVRFNGKGHRPADGLEPIPRARDSGTCTVADLGCGDATIALRLGESGVAKKRKVEVKSFDLAARNERVTVADIAKLPLRDGSVDIAVFCLALMGTNWLEFVEEAWRVLRWKGELWVAEIKSRFARPKGRNEMVEHSVGKRRKGASAAKRDEAQEGKAEEEALRTEVDGEVKGEGTDVGGFVKALERRGFVLRKGQESVDLSNKMFVRMEFVKAGTPRTGKDAKMDEAGKGAGRKRFVEEEDVDPEAEAKVLKPCLYKIR